MGLYCIDEMFNMDSPPNLKYIPVQSIENNPLQPRVVMAENKLKMLADSIKSFGVLVPIQVHLREDGKHILIAGHRRVAAVKLLGSNMIPARILTVEKVSLLEGAISENMQRENLDVIEVAMALGILAADGTDRKRLCLITGLSSQSISELLLINNIPREVCIQCLENGKTTKRFLIDLSRFGNEHDIRDAFKYFQVNNKLPTRKKRNYSKKTIKDEHLKLLSKLNSYLAESADNDYLADGELDDMFRHETISFLLNLEKRGWFLPRKFDTSNLG
jgi:ParB/RepB/Spo0J family partition protein